MTPAGETLTVVLEDIGAAAWWTGILAVLGSQYGNAQRRFVGQVDGRTRYRSSTFAVPRAVTEMSPQEQWAPGMTEALAELKRDLAADGWMLTSHGKDPWSLTYARGGFRT
jgi:hypothetical protein